MNSGLVNPKEIETLLGSHVSISDAVVAPVYVNGKHDVAKVKAFVVKKNGHDLTEVEVVEFVNERVAKWKQLEGGVEFIDAVPRTSLGKIERWRFDEMIKRSLGPNDGEDSKSPEALPT